MLATNALTQTQAITVRCVACRYFVHDRCSHSTARLTSEETKTGDCPYFRFVHTMTVSQSY